MQGDGQRHPLHAGDGTDRLPDHSLSHAQQPHGSAHQLCEYSPTCLQTISVMFPGIFRIGTSRCATNNDVGQALLHYLCPPKHYLTGVFNRPFVRGQQPLTNTLTDTPPLKTWLKDLSISFFCKNQSIFHTVQDLKSFNKNVNILEENGLYLNENIEILSLHDI